MLNNIKKQRGINMIEVLVTIVITSIGLLGLNSLQLQASRSTLDSGNRSQAVWILEDLTNRMRANLIGIQDYDTNGAMVCGTAPTNCSSYHDGTNKVAATNNCTAADQAASDLHEVLCGFRASTAGSNDIIFSSAANFIANPELTVAVDANNSTKITLSWDIRTSGVDSNNQAVYASDSSNISTQRATISAEAHP